MIRRKVMSESSDEKRIQLDGMENVRERLLYANGEAYTERVVIGKDSREEEEEDSGVSDLVCEDHHLENAQNGNGHLLEKREKSWTIFIQIFIPFLIAGAGVMLAGLLLDEVQHWEVYVKLNEIFILVPALLGLKGNLEMTLAARLSTAANVGHLDSPKERWHLTWGNLSLIQVQALVVAALATVLSVVLGRDLAGSHILLLGASAMGAAAIASALLGSIMILVILVSHSLKINPDNVATPIAASLGDLVTLGLLSVLAKGLFDIGEGFQSSREAASAGGSGSSLILNETSSPHPTVVWSSVILSVLVVLIPVWLLLAYRNSATKAVLFYGWIPVLSAMCISSGGGYVLSKAVNTWEGIAIYSPIINGVGGNLVAVQASRISTALHQLGTPGKLPKDSSEGYHGPHRTFCSKGQHSKTALILVGMSLPGSAVFLILIYLLGAGHTSLSPLFFCGYLICSTLQVVLLLMVADWMVHFIWMLGFDPDNIAIPFLTALGDLLGTGLLSLGFLIMWQVGDKDSDVGD